jgi:hypothetical protein
MSAMTGTKATAKTRINKHTILCIAAPFSGHVALMVMNEPLGARRQLLQERVLAKLGEPIRESPELDASLPDLISSVTAHGLEGLVAKRRDSRYESGERSGAWQKMRVNRGARLFWTLSNSTTAQP